mmetsp:Transcript_34368/g.81453  ORF Transcript_34368/g.81453 Transcript_34368/m.81453 type:complete len:210 (+) Transcript_34368:303-932(+)
MLPRGRGEGHQGKTRPQPTRLPVGSRMSALKPKPIQRPVPSSMNPMTSSRLNPSHTQRTGKEFPSHGKSLCHCGRGMSSHRFSRVDSPAVKVYACMKVLIVDVMRKSHTVGMPAADIRGTRKMVSTRLTMYSPTQTMSMPLNLAGACGDGVSPASSVAAVSSWPDRRRSRAVCVSARTSGSDWVKACTAAESGRRSELWSHASREARSR